MDNTRIARTAPPSIPPDDVERLLEACREALRYLDRADAHLPEGYALGGEDTLRRQLRQAIRGAER